MMTKKTVLGLALMLALGACKKTEVPPPKADPVESVVVPEVTPMDEADVRGVLTTWQSSQNDHDLPAYSALYSSKFEGVTRSGAKVSRLDRDGWILSRRRGFEEKTDIRVEEPSIAFSGTSAVVRFSQGSRVEGATEIGEKVLVLEKTSEGTKIVREVLEPQIESGPKQAFDANRWAPELLDEFLVLSDTVDDVWLADTKRFVGEGPMIGTLAVAETWVDVAKLPLPLRSLKGRTFSIKGQKECRATVQGFRVISRATPHFSVVEDWRSRPATKEAQTEIAGEIVEMASTSGRVLVAKLDKRCPGVWAQAVHDGSDQIFTVETDQAIDEDILNSARKTEAWSQIEEQASEFGQGDWFDPSKVNFTVFSSGKQRFASLSFKIGAGCGEFYAEYSAILDVSDKPIVLHDTLNRPFFEPKAVMKISGEVIFVGEDRAAVLDETGVKSLMSWAAPYFDCPC